MPVPLRLIMNFLSLQQQRPFQPIDWAMLHLQWLPLVALVKSSPWQVVDPQSGPWALMSWHLDLPLEEWVICVDLSDPFV